MSKRNSVAASNTLFNYFTKTPPSNKKIKATVNGQEIKNNSESYDSLRDIKCKESKCFNLVNFFYIYSKFLLTVTPKALK